MFNALHPFPKEVGLIPINVAEKSLTIGWDDNISQGNIPII